MSDTPECPAGDECTSPFCVVHGDANAAEVEKQARRAARATTPDAAGLRALHREVADLARDLHNLRHMFEAFGEQARNVDEAIAELRERIAVLEAAIVEDEAEADPNVTL